MSFLLFFSSLSYSRIIRHPSPCQVCQVSSASLAFMARAPTENSSACVVNGCSRPPRVVLAIYHIPAHLTRAVGFLRSTGWNCQGLYSLYSMLSSATPVGHMQILYLRYSTPSVPYRERALYFEPLPSSTVRNTKSKRTVPCARV